MTTWLRDAGFLAVGLSLAAIITSGYRSCYVRDDVRPAPLHYSFEGIEPVDADAVALRFGWTDGSRYTRILREWIAKREARLAGLRDRSLGPDERTGRYNRAAQEESAWLIREIGHPVAQDVVAIIPLLRIDPTTSRSYVADLFGNKVRDFP